MTLLVLALELEKALLLLIGVKVYIFIIFPFFFFLLFFLNNFNKIPHLKSACDLAIYQIQYSNDISLLKIIFTENIVPNNFL
jgi:hypothetical protein